MRCPQCKLQTHQKNDLCPRCDADLRPLKYNLDLPIQDLHSTREELLEAKKQKLQIKTESPPPNNKGSDLKKIITRTPMSTSSHLWEALLELAPRKKDSCIKTQITFNEVIDPDQQKKIEFLFSEIMEISIGIKNRVAVGIKEKEFKKQEDELILTQLSEEALQEETMKEESLSEAIPLIPLASPIKRIFAGVIDFFIALILGSCIFFFFGLSRNNRQELLSGQFELRLLWHVIEIPLYTIGAWFVISTLMLLLASNQPGMALMKLKIVTLEGTKPGLLAVMSRVASQICCLPFILPSLPFFKGLNLPDFLSSTRVSVQPDELGLRNRR